MRSVYSFKEKTISIYSLPKSDWTFMRLQDFPYQIFLDIGAIVKEEEGKFVVNWPESIDLEFFLYKILLHELGHHHSYKVRTTPKMSRRSKYQKELAAEVFSQKIFKKMFNKKG